MKISKDELLMIPKLSREIQSEQTRIDNMRQRLYSPQGFDDRERVQSSGREGSALVDVVLDMEQKLETKRKRLEYLKSGAEEAFKRLPLEERELMTLRYLSAQSWDVVATVMNYAPVTVYKKHQKIMKTLFGCEQ